MVDKQEVLHMLENGYFSTPQILQIEITNRCSLTCPQCYKDEKNEGDMELVLFRKLLSEADEMKVGTLMLNGGEPFQHKNILKLFDELDKYKFQVHCFTSGLCLTEAMIKRIKNLKFDFNLNVSLNGSTELINKQSRDGYQIALQAIEMLVKPGIKIGINWVCRHDNVHDFPELVEFAKKKGVNWINIAANKLSGTGEIISPLTVDDYRFLRAYIIEQMKVDPKYIRIQYCYTFLNALRGAGYNRNLDGCGAGKTFCNIDVLGKYRPCTHLYYPEEYSSIIDYWTNSSVLKQLRDSRKASKKCKDCLKTGECYYCKAMFVNTAKNFYEEPENCPLRVLYEENY